MFKCTNEYVEIIKASRNAKKVILRGDIQYIREECDFGSNIKYKTQYLCFEYPTPEGREKADHATYNR